VLGEMAADSQINFLYSMIQETLISTCIQKLSRNIVKTVLSHKTSFS
jgi:hypothetical protein